MIIQTGQRTDIPAFYSQWLLNRLKEGYVMVRNPFYPSSVSRYELNSQIVDLITFCTKNPLPVLQNQELWNELSILKRISANYKEEITSKKIFIFCR